MSTWYDVYCYTCKSHAGIHENHAEKECADLISNAKLVAEMAPGFRALKDIGIEVRLTLKWEQMRVDPEWFEKHVEHQLVVIDEYGRLYPECLKRFTCCERTDCEWLYCRRKQNHDGDCSGKRDAP